MNFIDKIIEDIMGTNIKWVRIRNKFHESFLGQADFILAVGDLSPIVEESVMFSSYKKQQNSYSKLKEILKSSGRECITCLMRTYTVPLSNVVVIP